MLMYQYQYKGSVSAIDNGILGQNVLESSQSVGTGWDNPLVSEPKSQKSKKTAVQRAACCPALRALGAEAPGHSSTCPRLHDAGGQQPAWPWVPLPPRVQPPPFGMACRFARIPAYHVKGPDRPLNTPTVGLTSPQPTVCNRQGLHVLYSMS